MRVKPFIPPLSYKNFRSASVLISVYPWLKFPLRSLRSSNLIEKASGTV